MAEDKKKAKKTDKKSDKKKSKNNPFKSIAGFFKGVRNEGKKVKWPGAKEVFKNTMTVLVVILIVGAMIWVVDLGLSSGMKGIKNLANTTTTTAVAEEKTEEATEATTQATTEATTAAESTTAK